VRGYWNADIGPARPPFNLIKKKSFCDQITCRFAFALCNAGSARQLRLAFAAERATALFLVNVA
jgi:hypothetical protein